jgi:hypothetical protein
MSSIVKFFKKREREIEREREREKRREREKETQAWWCIPIIPALGRLR